MIKLIIRADDIGYSEAVNYGIEKSVKEGNYVTLGDLHKHSWLLTRLL